MLENVFSKTRLIQGEKQLSQKYEPRNVSECCVSEEDLLTVRQYLQNERFFAVHSDSGCGATICVKCVANETGLFFVHELSCTNGCSEILKLIKQNMKNVLLALQQQSKSIIFFIKDIEAMKRNERSQILSAIEESNVRAVLFFNNVLFHTKWKRIKFSPLTFDDKMIHLCWICAEEKIDIELEEIQKFAEFSDLRNAINSLSLKVNTIENTIENTTVNIQERDRLPIDEYSKMLFAHETIGHNDIDVISTFADLFCINDISEFKATRYWYTNIISDYIDKHDFEYTRKQSFVARHAQMVHRINCLHNACKLFSIHPPEMKMYASLYRNILLNKINPLKTTSPNYDFEAKSLYTIAKIGASSPQCKLMKNTLKIK